MCIRDSEHGEQLSGDGENLSAGQEVLRCPQIGEQPGQGRPQGAAAVSYTHLDVYKRQRA